MRVRTAHALFDQAEKQAPGFDFVVRSMTIEFLKPARMDDVLEVVSAGRARPIPKPLRLAMRADQGAAKAPNG